MEMRPADQYSSGADWYDQLTSENDKKLLDGAIVYDDYYGSILGYACVPEPVLVYDIQSMLKELSETMTWDEAQEWIDFNVAGGWLGERTPVLLDEYHKWMGVPLPIGYRGTGVRCGQDDIALFDQLCPAFQQGTYVSAKTLLGPIGEPDVHYAVVKLEPLESFNKEVTKA